jgi:hypothetical protein
MFKYLPLVKAFAIIIVCGGGYLIIKGVQTPLGLAVIQVVAMYNIILLLVEIRYFGNDIFIVNISTITSLVMLVAAVALCHRHLAAPHGSLWRLAFDDRTMVYFRRWFRVSRDGIIKLPLIGGIIGIIIFFFDKIKESFVEKRWTFGHIVLIVSLFVEIILFSYAIKDNIDSFKYGNRELGDIIKLLQHKYAINRSIDLFSFSLFGVLLFASASLLKISYLKTISVIVPVISIAFVFVQDALSASLIPWPMYLIALLFIALGICLLRSNPRRIRS